MALQCAAVFDRMTPMADPAQSSSSFSFVDMEHQILDFWEQGRVFQRTLENTR